MDEKRAGQAGFTLVELSLTLVIMSIVIVSLFGLFVSLVNSATTAKRRAVALTLATNQMEYLKSLPYDSLAVAGGSIAAVNPLPASFTKKVSNVPYTVTTSVSYVDDAYDGCGSYPTQDLKQQYCRNYPPPAAAPSTDTNPADYKIAHVAVKNSAGTQLASVDTQISARVSETASTTGAMFVSVVDGSGNPVTGATVNVADTTVNPTINLTDTTDENGIAIFYKLTPDSGSDYVVTASSSGYSTLKTIVSAGALQPTFPNQKVFSQQSSYVAMKLYPQGTNSLIVETTDTSGNPVGNVKVYIKGGYKKYTSTGDTQYYYDNMSGSDARPTTDTSTGLVGVTGLVPLNYIFCGDDGSVNCRSASGSTTYYLAAAVPYSGNNSLSPITVPTYDPGNPPATSFDLGGTAYLQKVRLMLTTSASFPRVFTLSPYEATSASNLSAFAFTIGGKNLSCNQNPGSCATTVKLVQNGNTVTASCTGTSSGQNAGTSLNCTANISAFTSGTAQLIVSNSGGTLTLPTDPLLGGLHVNP